MTHHFYTAGPEFFASSRMRAYWPAQYMDAVAMPLRESIDALKQGAPIGGALIFQKSAPLDVVRDYHETGHSIWWDVCDPSWWFEPDTCADIVRNIDGVVASSKALLDDFMCWMVDVSVPDAIECHVIPDRLELSHFPKTRMHRETEPVRLIWYGVSVNRIALHAAAPTLERLAVNGYEFTLTIFDNEPENAKQLSTAFDTYYTRWNLERENEVLASHDIAVLPPYPGAWGKVKSNNKTITAYANGLPVTEGIEYGELVALMDWRNRQTAAEQGRRIAEKEYDVRESARQWEAILCES